MPPPLRSIAILATSDQTEQEALSEWARGSEWIAWLMQDIPAKLPSLGPTPPPSGHHALVHTVWDDFVAQRFLPQQASLLTRIWEAAEKGRTRELQKLACELHALLPVAARDHSTHAAELLLATTRRAGHQGILGKHRAAVAAGLCPAHLLVVWTIIGSLFHLGLAVICGEYLRLHWQMIARHHTGMAEPVGQHSIAGLTQQLLNGHLPQGFAPAPDSVARES